jgi:uncharacterized protein (TIGR02246 family)
MTAHLKLLLILALVGLMCGCAPQTALDTRQADERALRDTEAVWSKAASAKDLDGFVSYYADDAAMFLPNAPIVTGKDAIRKSTEEMFANPGFSLSFQTAKVEVSRGGDLAYTHGTYTMAMNDPKGKPVSDKGKYVTVYKRQADGKWKAVADIINSDLAPAAAAKGKS